MARIKNKDIYPIKPTPNNNDYVVGTDNEDNGKTVSFRLGSLLAQTGAEGNFVPKGGFEGTGQDLIVSLGTKVDKNTAIIGGTYTKISFDNKGLIIGGVNATTADINDSANRRYVTDADLVDIGNLSGVNSGDQTSIVGITGTKAQFNTSLTDGDFVFAADITESAQDAVGTILTDTSTIGFTYDDLTPTISAIVKPNSITATELSNTINISEFVNNANYATSAYVDGLVVGLLDDRGSYNASTNVFPTTGGSGTAGAILKGDIWYVSVAGTLGGQVVNVGDSFRALVDSPAQITTNWSILEANIGYVPENVANKSTNISLGTSNILYPTENAVKTYTDAKITQTITNGVVTTAPSEDAVYDALATKQLVFTGIDQAQFLTENDIVIDNTALTLTIATVKNGTAITSNNPVIFYTDGNGIAIRHVKTSPVVFTFTNTTGIWYFYFDSSGNPIATQTSPTDSSTIARVYRIYWNAGLAIADKRVIESLEVYKNDATWIDRDWKDTQGAQYSSGFTLTSNVLASGTPAIDGSNAVVNLTSGTIIDANLSYTLTNASTGTTKFTQNLGSGLLPATSGKFITITNNASLVLDKIPATDFPFLWNTTTNTPEYLTQLGVRTGVTANNFFVYYLYAIQDPRRGETIKIKSAEIDFANSSLAEAHSWTQLQTLFPTLRDSKIRVLYKLTFEHKTAFDIGTKKSALRKIDDLRKQRTTSTATVGGVIPASTVSFTAAGNISSTNVQLALEEVDAEKAPLASPALTGVPTAPTATVGTNGNQIATLDFVSGANFWTNTAGTIRNNNANEVEIKPLNKVSILNSGGTETAKITAGGSFVSKLAGTTGFFGSDEASGMYQNTGNQLVFRSAQDGFLFEPRVYSGALAFGDIIKFKSGFEFSPTSGTGVFNVLNLTGTINQTGGANGITRGIYINPTLTSAANFRAIDVTAGTILAPSFTKVGGTSSQFLKADGSSDATVYQTALTNPITGTGTSGYLPKWTGTGTQGNSLAYDDGSGIGIGTTSLNSKLTIGSSDADAVITPGGTNTFLTLSGMGANGGMIFKAGGVANGSQGLERMRVADTGNVLIGTTTDDGVNKLQVNGGARIKTAIDYNFAFRQDAGVAQLTCLNDAVSSHMAFKLGNNWLNFTSAGGVSMSSLSGTGTRTVVADASGNLSTESISTKTVSYTTTLSDGTVLVDATAGNITITLLAAAGNSDKKFTVKKIDSTANTVTVSNAAGIDGTTTKVYSTQYSGGSFQSNGTKYFIIGNF